MGFSSCGVLGSVDGWVTLTVAVPFGSPIAVQWNVAPADSVHLKHYLLIRLVRGTAPTAIAFQSRATRVYPESIKQMVSVESLPPEEPGSSTYIQMRRRYFYRSFSVISEPVHSIEAFYYSP